MLAFTDVVLGFVFSFAYSDQICYLDFHIILQHIGSVFSRRPILEGDNWWRGHAAAFLKYVKLPPEVLRRGRVNQVRFFILYTF